MYNICMGLHQQIKANIKAAMIAKDTILLTTLRNVQATIMNEIVAKKLTSDELGDEEVLAIIRRLVKQRKDSIEQFTKGNRMDLVEAEQKELEILEKYLPQMMNEEEVKKFVEQKIAEAGTIDKMKLGQFIGTIMKDLKGKADGALVKKIVEEKVQ